MHARAIKLGQKFESTNTLETSVNKADELYSQEIGKVSGSSESESESDSDDDEDEDDASSSDFKEEEKKEMDMTCIIRVNGKMILGEWDAGGYETFNWNKENFTT